jgi:hypothetical protein
MAIVTYNSTLNARRSACGAEWPLPDHCCCGVRRRYEGTALSPKVATNS